MKKFIDTHRQLSNWILFFVWWATFAIIVTKVFVNLSFFIIFCLMFCTSAICASEYLSDDHLFSFIFPKLPKTVYHDKGLFYIRVTKYSTMSQVTLYEDKLFYLKKIDRYYDCTDIEELKKKIQSTLEKRYVSKVDSKKFDEWDGNVYTSKSIAREEKLKKII